MEKENKNLNESIISIRVKLQNAKLKKSGKNKFAGFDYFELGDFLQKLNELMLEEGVNDRFYIKDNYARLELQKGEEINTYTMPFVLFDTPINAKTNEKTGEVREVKSMHDIQYLGALNTYYKRYLYLNAFGITDGEVIDSMNNSDLEVDTTDYRSLLATKLKEQGLLAEYAKTYKLNAKTPQSKCKELLEKLKEVK